MTLEDIEQKMEGEIAESAHPAAVDKESLLTLSAHNGERADYGAVFSK